MVARKFPSPTFSHKHLRGCLGPDQVPPSPCKVKFPDSPVSTVLHGYQGLSRGIRNSAPAVDCWWGIQGRLGPGHQTGIRRRLEIGDAQGLLALLLRLGRAGLAPGSPKIFRRSLAGHSTKNPSGLRDTKGTNFRGRSTNERSRVVSVVSLPALPQGGLPVGPGGPPQAPSTPRPWAALHEATSAPANLFDAGAVSSHPPSLRSGNVVGRNLKGAPVGTVGIVEPGGIRKRAEVAPLIAVL